MRNIYTNQLLLPLVNQSLINQQDLDTYEAKVNKANAKLFAIWLNLFLMSIKTIKYLQFSRLVFKSDMPLKQQSIE